MEKRSDFVDPIVDTCLPFFLTEKGNFTQWSGTGVPAYYIDSCLY